MKVELRAAEAMLLFNILLACPTHLLGQELEGFPLEGIVLGIWGDNYKSPQVMESGQAQVTLTDAEGKSETTHTDEQGLFHFRVLPGKYTLTVTAFGFYPTTVSDLVLTEETIKGLTQGGLRPVPLVVALPSHFMFSEPLVIGPEIVPAPDLSLAVTLEPPIEKGERVRLRVKITNRGSETVLVPSQLWTGGEVDFLMNMVLTTPPTAGPFRALFNGWYGCKTRDPECRLHPGKSLEIPIAVYKEEVEPSEREPVLYKVPGVFRGKVQIDFVLPRQDEDERQRRTENIAADFKFDINLN